MYGVAVAVVDAEALVYEIDEAETERLRAALAAKDERPRGMAPFEVNPIGEQLFERPDALGTRSRAPPDRPRDRTKRRDGGYRAGRHGVRDRRGSRRSAPRRDGGRRAAAPSEAWRRGTAPRAHRGDREPFMATGRSTRTGSRSRSARSLRSRSAAGTMVTSPARSWTPTAASSARATSSPRPARLENIRIALEARRRDIRARRQDNSYVTDCGPVRQDRADPGGVPQGAVPGEHAVGSPGA